MSNKTMNRTINGISIIPGPIPDTKPRKQSNPINNNKKIHYEINEHLVSNNNWG